MPTCSSDLWIRISISWHGKWTWCSRDSFRNAGTKKVQKLVDLAKLNGKKSTKTCNEYCSQFPAVFRSTNQLQIEKKKRPNKQVYGARIGRTLWQRSVSTLLCPMSLGIRGCVASLVTICPWWRQLSTSFWLPTSQAKIKKVSITSLPLKKSQTTNLWYHQTSLGNHNWPINVSSSEPRCLAWVYRKPVSSTPKGTVCRVLFFGRASAKPRGPVKFRSPV